MWTSSFVRSLCNISDRHARGGAVMRYVFFQSFHTQRYKVEVRILSLFRCILLDLSFYSSFSLCLTFTSALFIPLSLNPFNPNIAHSPTLARHSHHLFRRISHPHSRVFLRFLHQSCSLSRAAPSLLLRSHLSSSARPHAGSVYPCGS